MVEQPGTSYARAVGDLREVVYGELLEAGACHYRMPVEADAVRGKENGVESFVLVGAC